MPIYQLECLMCGRVEDVIMSWKTFQAMLPMVQDGEFEHRVILLDTSTITCGVFRQKMTLPNVYSSSGYPMQAPPWLFPPRLNEQTNKMEPYMPMIDNLSDHKRLMKEHGMVQLEGPGERLTMYDEPLDKGRQAREDRHAEGDMKTYERLLRNPEARKRVIKHAVAKRETAIAQGIL